jgi:hypothetical protein
MAAIDWLVLAHPTHDDSHLGRFVDYAENTDFDLKIVSDRKAVRIRFKAQSWLDARSRRRPPQTRGDLLCSRRRLSATRLRRMAKKFDTKGRFTRAIAPALVYGSQHAT